MIKGINRQVVEVSDTGSEYFEKIMFFVNFFRRLFNSFI